MLRVVVVLPAGKLWGAIGRMGVLMAHNYL
jgi:hypothetical protein